MADTPIPRSYEQIVSDIVDSFIARTGISALKVGSPILSMIEAVAQSQMRNSQDTFNLLASQSLDHATGDALTQIAADEGLVRKNASASFGYVTFTDNAFTKVSTQLTAGASRGQNYLTVNDITGFATNDSIVIGNEVRVISNVSGNTITLNGTLSSVYSIGTEVVKSQGNARTIPAGTSVGTGTINFTTVNSATIPAGYTSVANVSVVCATEGTTGNVPASTINVINSTLTLTSPTVTNPYGFINGQDQETDDELRDRVRYARRNKQKGTPQAIQNAAIGVQSPVASGESKKVISASVSDTGVGKASLYIDDGTGYEPITSPIGIETLTASATGGEKYFELQGGRPVTHCFVESELTFPTDLRAGASIEVTTTSGTSKIDIPAVSFADPKNATSYELVSFINAETDLTFVAAARDNHTKVILYPKSDNDNTITVTAQARLGFTTNYPVSTLYLFRNGVLQVEGATEDYTLNRYKGQIFLNTELARGESLVVGSVDIRTGIITNPLSSNGTFANQYIWLIPDDDTVSEKAHIASGSVAHSYTGTTLTLTKSGAFTQVSVGDWLVLWDSAFGKYWTKRVVSLTDNIINVECSSDPSLPTSPITLAQGGFYVYRTDGKVPHRVAIPSTYSNLDSLVSSLQDEVGMGIYVNKVGVDRIGFYTGSYKSATDSDPTTGGIKFLTGTPTAVGVFGFTSATEKYNPQYYQTSLTSNPEMGNLALLTPKTASPVLGTVGKITQFRNGEQGPFTTTQLNAANYRHTLNEEPVVTTDERYVSSGFHISDTDTLTVVVDESSAKTYTFPLSIAAKIDGTNVTAQDGSSLTYTGSLNDWAIWAASNQTATPTTGVGNNTIAFTSKLYGSANTVNKIEYAYPLLPNQTEASYVTNEGVLSVVLPSGDLVVPTQIETSQRFWIGNYNGTDKTMRLNYRINAASVSVGADSTKKTLYVDGDLTGDYPGFADTCPVDTDCYLYIVDVPNNFKVLQVQKNLTTSEITVRDPDGQLQYYVDNLLGVNFSISKSSVANAPATLSNLSGGNLFSDSVTNKAYRIKTAQSQYIEFYSFELATDVRETSQISFLERDTSTAIALDNPYFSLSPSGSVVVSDSTEYVLDFEAPAIAADGVVSGSTTSLDFVKETSPFESKKGTTYTNCLVRFVPVTAQNVSDSLDFNLAAAGVNATASSEGKVELARNEGGSSVSVQISGGFANKTVVTINTLGQDYCLINTSNAPQFVVGYPVKTSSTNGYSKNTTILNTIVTENNQTKVYFSDNITDYSYYQNPTLTALNKLGFPENEPATNSDGYKYYSGLLGEVNKVIYGDPTDPVNYPGYASANANIEVTAPQVKQVFLNIFVRMQSGFTLSEAKLAIRNAAAAAVNATPVGQDVAYSDVISAVNAINGVFAVAIEDNTTSNPTIPVLSYEKPLIIDLEKDINVTITGI